MKFRTRLLAILLLGGMSLACAGTYYLFVHSVYVSWAYEVEARFQTFPPDDRALKAWLQEQPGVVRHTVAVGRFDADAKCLSVMFIQVRNVASEPPFPNLEGACKELGYATPDGPFRDSTDRGRSYLENP